MVIKLWWWWCFSKRVPFQEPQTRAKVYINAWISCVEHWAEAFRDAWIFLKFVREIGSGSLPPLVPSYRYNLDTNFKLSSGNWKFNDNGPSYFRNRSPYFIKKIHEQQVPYWWVSQKWYWLCGHSEGRMWGQKRGWCDDWVQVHQSLMRSTLTERGIPICRGPAKKRLKV